jgi:hypothetical protein
LAYGFAKRIMPPFVYKERLTPCGSKTCLSIA